MTSLLSAGRAANSRPHFAPPPWPDDDPRRQELGDRLPANHLARRIDQGVARLDLSMVFAAYAGTGSPAHPPDLLLRAVLYEVRRGQHSPAGWHRDAHESEPIRWLLRGCTPARSCWYTFRDRIGPYLDELNRQVLHQAVTEGLTPARRGALDGTVVAANASRRKMVKAATLVERLALLAGFGTTNGHRRPAWMARTSTGRRRQQRRLQRAQVRLVELQAQNRARKKSKQCVSEWMKVSPADPDAALGKDKDGLFRPLFNVQLVDDLDSTLVLGYAVLNQPNDAGAVGPLLKRVATLVGHRLDTLLVDTAYTGGPDLASAADMGVTLYGPLPRDGARAAKQFPKSRFTWLSNEQVYICPQGHRMPYAGPGQQKRSGPGTVLLRFYRCPATYCMACPQASQCTPRPDQGRTVSRSQYEELVEALRERMDRAEAKVLYRRRSRTVELTAADWKEHRKLRRFSGRGLTRATCQIGLIVLAQNLLTIPAQEPHPP